MPEIRKACPICAHVSPEIHCPPCRAKGIIVRTFTLTQLQAQMKKYRHSAGLLNAAIRALEQRLEPARQ